MNNEYDMCGVSGLAVLRLLADVGSFCRDFHDIMVRGLRCRRLQADEIRSFCDCKHKSKETVRTNSK